MPLFRSASEPPFQAPGHAGALSKIFAFAWAFQALEEKSDRLDLNDLVTLDAASDFLVIAAALAVLWSPGSASRLALFCAVSIFNFVVELPYVVNHAYVVTLVNLGLLWHLPACLPVRRRLPGGCASWMVDRLAGTVRRIVILLYYLAVLHKLNRGFFDPDQSCVVHVCERLAGILPFLPPLEGSARHVAIYVTLLFELGIPTLLMIPKVRIFGIVAGLLFHLGLGFVYPSFSTMIFALYLFFLPAGLVDRWARTFNRIAIGRFTGLRLIQTSALVLVAALYFFAQLAGHRLLRLTWGIPATALVVWFMFSLLRNRSAREAAGDAPVPAAPRLAGAVLFTLLLVNGLGPYLGFKTTTVFSMYSNLRTEQTSNHLLIPKGSLQIVDFQDDLVRIEDADGEPYRSYAAEGYSLPLLELQRQLSRDRAVGARGIWMVLEHLGRRHESAQMEQHPVFAADMNWFLRKFTVFRPVAPSNQCLW